MSELSVSCEALRKAMRRIADVVQRETGCLRLSLSPDLVGFNEEKARALMHLDRALRAVDAEEARHALSGELATLRLQLEENRRLLAIHRDAATQVIAVVAEALLAEESDGTYQRFPERALAAPKAGTA